MKQFDERFGAEIHMHTYKEMFSNFKLKMDFYLTKGFCRWKIRVIFIHLLDLTRSSCEKCNYRPSGRIEPPCDSGAAL